MRKVKTILICGSFLLITFFVFSMTVLSQQTDLNFINFNSKSGLSSNSVLSIIKDRFGYMWFGTDYGLNRFDGVNFSVYKSRAGDSNSLAGNEIMSMIEDKKGNLWIGTDESLSMYDRKKDCFINYHFLKNSGARSLANDKTGMLWIGSYSGLYRFDPLTHQAKHYLPGDSATGRLSSNTVLSLLADSRGRVWIGTPAGLYQYQSLTDNFKRIRSSVNNTSLPSDLIRSITEDKYGNIWFGTDAGVSRLKPGDSVFTNYAHNNSLNSLSCNRVYTVVPDKTGKVWVGTEKGLNILDPVANTVKQVAGGARHGYSLPAKPVKSIYVDTNGLYWVGSFQGGVNKYDENLPFFNLAHFNQYDQHGLSAPVVSSFADAGNDKIYIGTDAGGLNLFDRKTGRYIHPKLDKDGKEISVLSLEKNGDDLWIGTFADGIYILNTKTNNVHKVPVGSGTEGITGPDVFCLLKAHDGKIWIGTNGNGVNVFDPVTRQFRHFGQNAVDDGVKLLRDGYIRSFAEDSSGNIWIGTQGGGICVFDRSTQKFRVLNRQNSNISSNNVFNLFVDSRDRLWISTQGGGLNVYDRANDKFALIGEKEGLGNAVVYKILEDNSGKIWVSTNQGISSFDTARNRFKHYTSQNGIQKSTFVKGSGLKTASGEMFFGGLEGFNFFNPSALEVPRNVPSLIFTDLRIANKTVIPGERSPISENISSAQTINLDYKQNFSIDFAVLNYTSPLDNHYAYKLEGFDRDWNEIGNAHTAVYTNLDPGTYTFKVKAHSDDNLWMTPEKSITIYVKPPFWRTVYAYILYLLAAIGIFGYSRYVGIRKLKNKFRIEQEKLRLHQLIENEKREKERQHAFDELKIKFLTNLSHEFRTPIALIEGPIQRLSATETNVEKMEQISLVKRNSRRLLTLVNQLLDFRNLEEKESKLDATEADLIATVREVVDLFSDLCCHKHIEFRFITSLVAYICVHDKDKLERILFNLLSNAVKFTPRGGTVTLSVEPSPENGIVISVSDTGIGISEADLGRIFDRFFQGSAEPSVLNQGTGIGLSIAREFVRLHGGSIEVSSQRGAGTTFCVRLPFANPQVQYDVSADRSGKDIGTVAETSAEKKAERIAETVVETAAGIASDDFSETITGLEAVNVDESKVKGVAAPAQLPITIPDHEKLTVLLVEDNDEFREYVKSNLLAYYKIVEAADGHEGWQKALSAHPKIIISDIDMPGMDGISLCKKLRADKRTKHIPVILLTALSGDANALRGLGTGASDYLTKPFNFGILHVKIKNLLDLNQNFEETYTRQLKVSLPEPETQSHDEQLLLKITRYIEVNMDNPDLSVEDISKHVFMSRRSLYTKIVSLTGETPVEFVRSIKLARAAALLEKSDMKMGEVAYSAGFTTANYFTRAFKAKYNMSPTEYAQLKRSERTAGNIPRVSG